MGNQTNVCEEQRAYRNWRHSHPDADDRDAECKEKNHQRSPALPVLSVSESLHRVSCTDPSMLRSLLELR
jgi:hypothetical protein